MATSVRMPALALAPAVVAALLAAAPACAAAPAPFRVPVPVERTLANGLRVAVFPDHRLPLVQVQLLVPAGTAWEPAGSTGVATAVAQLLRAGTSSRTAAALAAEVDRLGGSLAASATRDVSTVSATFLAADLDGGLELMADAVVNSVFPADELERVRGQLAARLFQLQQSPAAQADDRLWEAAFGDHPYARAPLGTPEVLERMDWEAVRGFHRDFWRPDHALLAIAGDVDPAQALAFAADRFGGWAGRAAMPAAPVMPAPPAAPRVRVVDRPELARTEVRIGLLCPPRTDADALALQVADQLLVGGGPGSRLSRAAAAAGVAPAELRSGYAILRDAGLLSIAAPVEHGAVAAFVSRVREELARLASPGDPAEVAAAGRAFAGGFPLQFQTPAALLAQWSGADSYGLGAAWLDRFADDIAAVTPERVAAAAARWLDPARVVVVAVGPAATLAPALGSLGAVEVVRPGEAPAAARPEPAAPPDAAQLKRGRRLLEQALAAHGGTARLRRVKDSTVEGAMLLQIGGNEAELTMQILRKDPDRMRYSTRAAQLENGQVLRGDRGWTYMAVEDSLVVNEMDSVSVAAMRASFRGDVVHTLLAAAAPGALVSVRGTGRADGRELDVLEVVRPGAGGTPERSLLYLDPKTRLVAAEDMAEDPSRPGTFLSRRIYRDYRAVDGVQWPFYEERQRGGTKTMTVLLRSVKLDTGLADAWFERPRMPEKSGPLR